MAIQRIISSACLETKCLKLKEVERRRRKTSSSFKLLSAAEILQAHDVVDDVKTECRMAYSLVPGSS